MTIDEFKHETKRLEELYGKELNETQIGFWFESLKEYTLQQYISGVGAYAKKNKYFPTIADMISSIDYAKRQKFEREREEAEIFPCDKCLGTGYRLYKKIFEGREYEYASQCTCKNGDRVAYDGTKCKGDGKSNYYLRSYRDVCVGGEA